MNQDGKSRTFSAGLQFTCLRFFDDFIFSHGGFLTLVEKSINS